MDAYTRFLVNSEQMSYHDLRALCFNLERRAVKAESEYHALRKAADTLFGGRKSTEPRKEKEPKRNIVVY